MVQASGKLRVAPRDLGKSLAQIAIVFVAYFVAAKLGQATSNIRSGNIGPVWPAYGIALAAVLLYGYRVWPGIAMGYFLAAFLGPASYVVAVGQSAATTLAALAGAYLLRRVKFNLSLSRLRDALALIVLGAFSSAIVSASVGIAVLYATHMQAYSGLGYAWLIYWFGDSTGVLLITPLVLTLPGLLKIRPRSRLVEFAALLLLLAVASLAVFSDHSMLPVKLHVLAFAVLPFVIWAAVRFGISGATLATLFVATTATIETAFGSGPFARNTPFTNAVMLDVFFGVLSVSGMTLAATIAEREQAQSEREHLAREQAGMEARLRFAAIIESSDDAIIGMDVAGTITDWNKGAEWLYGYSAEEIIGKPIFLLIPPERYNDCAQIMKKVQQGDSVKHYETTRLRKDGTRIEVSLTGSPVFAPDGRIVGLSAIDRDITERKRQETILRDREERFRLAAHAGKMFAYEWNADTDVIVRSEESTQILGIDESSSLTREQALGRVHPDDREMVQSAMIALTPEEPYLQVSYRILRPDDTEIWVERNSRAHFDKQGRLVRVVGMIADITERKRAEEALSSARLKLIKAQEQERSRIARELHDDINQRLALLTVELDQLRHSPADMADEVRGRLDKLRREAAEIAADIQALSHELHSPKLEYLGITAAMKGFCRGFAEKQDVEIDFKTHDIPGSLPPEISLCLFRVLQEALHNSAKHSGAGNIEVRLWGAHDDIFLTVRDSGSGFDSAAVR
ncbi:MAG TPA: PAS domain S-box protein, partial [Verrucomicrobiae bacterium]|nr:PAS domain S-box protein [Verrucomicrobiae bacterium]